MTGWLAPDYSLDGHATDSLIRWIAWITIAFLVLVHGLLGIALIRFRKTRAVDVRPIDGDNRLELVWTIVPAAILFFLAIGSERVWRRYRAVSQTRDPSAAAILVIGQQFKWNVIYPGPDGRLGRYLIFPRPTDPAWPHRADDAKHLFRGVPGPASLPPAEAKRAIDDFISQPDPAFQLGKDFNDPDGADDDYEDAIGRPLYLPLDRPVRIVLMSRDVIHDFFLPNFRTQLYAVPGLTGTLALTATHLGNSGELVCGQLCGSGHATMHSDVIVLPAAEYHDRFEVRHR